MIYRLTLSEFDALFRRCNIPNVWLRAGMVGPWVHLVNLAQKHITCNTLEKHLILLHGTN